MTKITTAVLWLLERGLDIRCVRIYPYKLDEQVLVSVEQIIPLPSAEALQVGLREQSIGIQEGRRSTGTFTGYWFVNIGENNGPTNHRSWDDTRQYGFSQQAARACGSLSS